jgi:D-sedoheptulose 7-phosphate isomerase
MAERFAAGGRLVALGLSAQARSDVRHVTVEFVHPVIVGKRALPALGLSREGGSLPAQVELLVERGDIAIAFGAGAEVAEALALAGRRGALTAAFEVEADWAFAVPGEDPYVQQELAETLYHVLWELVHVFFEHPGLLEGREAPRSHDTGASSFLYPFLAESETDPEPVLDDVRRSVLLKADEATAVREQTLRDGRDELAAAAEALGACFDAGGKVLALGNGGSATDAMDVVADLREPLGGRRARRALDLTEDPAVITAIANDIGTDAIFQRQVIAHGRPGDALLALSTSGNSVNVIDALAEGRRRGLMTVAMVGYDGGRVAADRLADHVVVTRSENIPRIQEAQATAYHTLVDLLPEEAQ